MNTAGRRIASVLAALAWTIGAGLAMAQSYGDQDQELILSAAGFRNQNLSNNPNSDGYSHGGLFRAPLPLPQGAELRQLCLFARDTASSAVTASVVAVKLVPGGGGDPAILTVPGSLVSSTHVGYGYWCTDQFSYTVRDVVDVDGDGTADAIAYYLQADLTESPTLEIGGFRVVWRRQESPPPQSPTFGDVPITDGGFALIEAMAASGITGGCGGGNYCPESHVTRRQMAVFLAKALGLHWGN